MTVKELKEFLRGEEDDTLVWGWGYKFQTKSLEEPDVYLTDGQDLFDFDESKIDPGHLRKVLVF